MKLAKLTKLCDLGRHMHDECYNPTESGCRWVATSGVTILLTCSYLVHVYFHFYIFDHILALVFEYFKEERHRLNQIGKSCIT